MSQILPSQDELLAHAAAEPAFAAWLQGHGPLQHSAETRAAVFRTAHQLVQAGLQPDLASVYQLFRALDRLTASALRIVVHMTYARRIRLDGQPLQAEDFKTQPEGHTGGALNMVPAYAGYLALNVLTGKTRAWLMGQGHCVAAIDALNVLTGNLHPEQERAYADGE
ncbi:xylulose 5-phosphate 3-epimerase, partial [Pseudomonas aeruginosa]|nr:xylulose 5-phosphate 3-epimerase [Pseudomonas aeruginosa]